MPKLLIPRKKREPVCGIVFGHSDGIEITWVPTARRLDIHGWYDHCVGIEGESLSLREFFDALGITEKHCAECFKGKA